MKHIGMDVHSTTTDITVLNSHGRKILYRKIHTRQEDLLELIKSIPGKKQVVVEESTLSDWIARLLKPHVTEFIRCQPQYNRLISESENKCDVQDSHSLAELSYLNKLRVVHHPTQFYRDLREGVRAYWFSSRQVTRAKNRLKAFFLFNGIENQEKQVYSQRQRSSMLDKIKNSQANLKLASIRYWELDAIIIVVGNKSVIILHLYHIAGQIIRVLPDSGAVVPADGFQPVVVIVYEFICLAVGVYHFLSSDTHCLGNMEKTCAVF